MPKLSPKQLEVLQLMNSGWELGRSSGISPRYWMQKGGLGKGGQYKDLHYKIIQALEDKNLVESHRGYPTTNYTLTSEALELLS